MLKKKTKRFLSIYGYLLRDCLESTVLVTLPQSALQTLPVPWPHLLPRSTAATLIPQSATARPHSGARRYISINSTIHSGELRAA